MLATAYLLFALNSAGLPAFTALSAYTSEETCKAAAAVINAALGTGDEPAKVACFSAASLQELAQSNGLGGQE